MNVAFYCASSATIAPKYYDAARLMGRLMAQNGYTVINGAGSMGLMAAVSDGCLEAGGEVIGIIPTFMIENDWHHKGLTRIIETEDMHQRQRKMAEMADAAVVMAGGTGTLAELSEVICWKQLGIYSMPIIIVNTDGYWDDVLNFLSRAKRENFMRDERCLVWKVVATPEEALRIINSELKP